MTAPYFINCTTQEKYQVKNHIREQDIDAYKNIGKLKAATDQKDPFHIYKLNCKAINREPSYVFKTSSKALELAIKMDEKSQPQGQISAMVLNMHILMLYIVMSKGTKQSPCEHMIQG